MKYLPKKFPNIATFFKGLTLKKKIIVLFLAFILILASIPTIYKAVKKPEYTTAKVTKNEITEIVTESGVISTSGKVDIYSPTNGVIEDIFVSNDEAVSEGQKLFTVKSTATEQEEKAALANYLTAKSTLDSANATLHSLQSTMFSDWDTYKQLAESSTYEKPTMELPNMNKGHFPSFISLKKTGLPLNKHIKISRMLLLKRKLK